MFCMRLALKKLALNGRKTIFKVAFFGAIQAVVLLLVLFLGGADAQMRSSLRTMLGDAELIARDQKAGIPAAFADVKSRFGAALADIQESYSAQATVAGEGGFESVECVGVREDFARYLNASVAWLDRPVPGIEPGCLYLDAETAEGFSCRSGDYVTVQWSDPEGGRMNTAMLEVRGVFVGSSLLFSGKAFMEIGGMRSLVMEEGAVNRVGLYFASRDRDSMRMTLVAINEKHHDAASIGSAALDPEGSVFGVYKYYNAIAALALWAMAAIFLLVSWFSNQNMFFAEYRGRREELATFLAYGMGVGGMRAIAAWEAVFQFLLSLAAAIAASAGVAAIASGFAVKDLAYADLIAAIGGPKLAFAVEPGTMAVVIAVMAASTVVSALAGANRYLRMEVRGITASAD